MPHKLGCLAWILPLAFALGAARPCPAVTSTAPRGEPPTVRIALALGRKEVPVGSTHGFTAVAALDGTRLETRFGGQVATVRLHSGRTRYDNRLDLRGGIVFEPRAGGILKVDGKAYRGLIRVEPDESGTLRLLNILDMETYLLGVIRSEMEANSPPQALEVQAVIARTFALRHVADRRNEPYDLKDSELSQVYGGMESEDPRTDSAVRATRGIILTGTEGALQTFYHSSCGGATESNEDVWNGEPLSYVRSRPCPPCRQDPPAAWKVDLDYDEVRKALRAKGIKAGSIQRLGFTRTPTGRIESVVLETASGLSKVPGNAFRMAVGAHRMKSLNAWIVQSGALPMAATGTSAGGDGVIRSIITQYLEGVTKDESRRLVLEGRGAGHGVGLCQKGAKGLAAGGMSRDDILRSYYQDFRLEVAY